MLAHQVAVGSADFLQRGEVLLAVEHVPGEAHDVLRLAFRLLENLEDVLDGLAELAGEGFFLPLALAGPADLAGDEHQPAADDDAVGEALGARPGGWLEYLHHAVFLSLKRWSFPVSVRGRVSTNSMARGYLYGAMACFTWSCNVRAVSGPASFPGFNTT